jgi:serine/threonine protein kinase
VSAKTLNCQKCGPRPDRLSRKPLIGNCVRRQIASAMATLSADGIIHGDLACRNVLVAGLNPVQVKVADFGQAKEGTEYYSDLTKSYSFSLRWAPPEVMTRGKWSEKSDVWAWGVTAWETFTDGLVPYGVLTSPHDVRDLVLRAENLARPQGCPDRVWEVIESCWAPDPAARPTFAEIVISFCPGS